MMLVNDGNGIYTDETRKYLPNNGQIGMVTDAAWVVQSMELIIVGEWMPISIFKFSGGIAGLEVIPNSSGWWNTILVDDLDNDGDMDFLVGNQGLNTDMTASPNQPVELFVKDFDGNLNMDPIIGYYKNGKHWVYPGLDELAVQMPTFRGVFPGYYMYANKTFEEILPPQIKENSLQYQVYTLASMLIEKKGKEYLLKELPPKTQVSPIFGFAVDDLNLDGIKDILAVGNFYDNQLSTGKLDASFGTFLKGKGQLEYEYVEPIKSGFAIRGEARDIKTISTSSKNRLILISRNNDSVCLFK